MRASLPDDFCNDIDRARHVNNTTFRTAMTDLTTTAVLPQSYAELFRLNPTIAWLSAMRLLPAD